MTRRCVLVLVVAVFATALWAQAPESAFRVRNSQPPPGPRITDYLRYQVDIAWRQDEARRARLSAVHTEADLRALQDELRRKLLAAIGGLPAAKTPLNARVTGRIQRDGYHIEKILFESQPGFHVTALLYVPDGAPAPRPAVLVACGHSTNGKVHYQALCQHLVKRGYVVLNWDTVGQGERSQFWDAARSRSRYNLTCGEHAVLGNLAYLAGANLARWEIWDGIRAFDYLVTRPEVDAARVSITGTSGGGFQAAHIAALEPRIHAAVPSCYLSSLPMRMANRIFADPDSDPEQDLYGMVSQGIDHAGLMLLAYPRPLFLAAAVEDFFPLEGARKTFREVAGVYRRLGRGDRIAMAQGYHRHSFSDENQTVAFAFLDRFNGIRTPESLPNADPLDEKALRVTESGQVLEDFKTGRTMLDLVREYYTGRKDSPKRALAALYHGPGDPVIAEWKVTPYQGWTPERSVAWEKTGTTTVEDATVDKYRLHHSGTLSVPLLHFHVNGATSGWTLLWFGEKGKATAADWPEIHKFLKEGYEVVSFDFRGQGEDAMRYLPGAASQEQTAIEAQYRDPLMSVLANYVYNSLLAGRPYFLQMIEDGEIVARFSRVQLRAKEVTVAGRGQYNVVAAAMSEAVPGLRLPSGAPAELPGWADLVQQKREQWPVEFLLPGGAYIQKTKVQSPKTKVQGPKTKGSKFKVQSPK